MVKVLSWDIDGVLNSQRTLEAFGCLPRSLNDAQDFAFDETAVRLLRKLLQPDVVSICHSSWRHHHTCHSLSGRLAIRIDAFTQGNGRLESVELMYNQFISEHDDFKLAILDDERVFRQSKYEDVRRGFVWVNPNDGLSSENYWTVHNILHT